MLPYGIVLCVMGIVLLAIWNAGLIRSQEAQKQKMVLCGILPLILLAMVYIGTSLVRTEVQLAKESALVFDTPEEAFHYKYDDDYEIKLIIEGNESAQVISYDNKRMSYCTVLLPKAEGGWNPEIQMYGKSMVRISSPRHGTILVNRFRNSDDFYLSIIYTGSTPGELFDNRGTEFLDHSGKVYAGENLHFGYVYRAFVDGIDENYVLTIDGEEFTFPNVR